MQKTFFEVDAPLSPEFTDDPLGCEWIELEQPDNWQGYKSSAEKAELIRRGKARSDGMRRPFKEKLSFAIRVIRKALTKHHSWAISFSAGNDSTALSIIAVEHMKLRIPHIMSNTRLEYPETIRNLNRWKQWLYSRNVPLHVAYPKKRPAAVWSEDGLPLFSKEVASKYRQWVATGNESHLTQLPSRILPALRRLREAGIMLTDKCCDELKKKPMREMDKRLGIKGHITGSRAEESEARKMAYLQRGALYFSSRNNQWLCNPLVHWLRQDIEELLAYHDVDVEQIPTSSGRSGCVNCGFGCHIDDKKGRENSLQILHSRNRTMYDKTMNDWGFGKACDVAGIATIPTRFLFDKD